MAERKQLLRAAGLITLGIAIGNAPEIYQAGANGLSDFQHSLQESEAKRESEENAKREANNKLAIKYGIDEISEFGLVGKHDLVGTPVYVTLKNQDQETQTLRISWVDNEGSVIVSYLNPENIKYNIPEDPSIDATAEFQFTDEYLRMLGWNPDKWGTNANDYLDDSRASTLITLNQAAFDSIQEPSS